MTHYIVRFKRDSIRNDGYTERLARRQEIQKDEPEWFKRQTDKERAEYILSCLHDEYPETIGQTYVAEVTPLSMSEVGLG